MNHFLDSLRCAITKNTKLSCYMQPVKFWLQELGGKDVTEEFYELHRHDVLKKYERLKVGHVMVLKCLNWSSLELHLHKVGRLEGSHVQITTGSHGVPFAEIPAFQGQDAKVEMLSFKLLEQILCLQQCNLCQESPFYNESHRKFMQDGLLMFCKGTPVLLFLRGSRVVNPSRFPEMTLCIAPLRPCKTS